VVESRFPQPLPCERGLELASLRLDGELSELESAALDQHLAACPRCTAAVVEIEAATALVRAAPLERPSRRLELPTRPVRPAARLAAVAAVLSLAVGFSVLGAAIGGGSEQRTPTAPDDVAVLPEDDFGDLRRLPRGGEDGRVPRPPRPIGVPV
jgi:ferric-dicitrate binding protein FerR (iron transport regulator)